MIIASGRRDDTLPRILAGEAVGTLVLAGGQAVTSRKRWIGYTAQPRGQLMLDAGACRAVESQGRSLLAIGILQSTGHFEKGDVVSLRDPAGQEFARGLTNYSAADLVRIQGLTTPQITDLLGRCPYDEVIHRDNMAIIR